MFIQRLNHQEKRLLQKIHKLTGFPNFWVCGSTTYYFILKKKFFLNDYDLVIDPNEISLNNCLRMLTNRGFKVVKNRTYYLKFKKIRQIIAIKKNIKLDIAITPNILDLGHFNFESIYWHFPTQILIDLYNGIDGIKKKKLIPIIKVDEKNPFFLITRIVKLINKFGPTCLNNNRYIKNFLNDVLKKIKNWKIFRGFHGKYARDHCYYYLFKSIIEAKNKKIFLELIYSKKILSTLFPEVDKKILTLIYKKIEYIKSIEDLINEIILNLNQTKRKNFYRKIKLTFYRLNTDKLVLIR